MQIKKVCKTETAHIVREAFSERCRFNIHGHSYKWEITLESGQLNNAGMVLDFGELGAVKDFIDLFDHSLVLWEKESEEIKLFMHKHFSRVIIMTKNPTAENMASLLYCYVKDWLENQDLPVVVKSVGVWETDTGYAEATDSDLEDALAFLSEELEESHRLIFQKYWRSEEGGIA